nr:MAG TPA: hypothetical protein [Caudoviricetes sp.]DAX88552.1 MAG TPA: hypothetical protein [Caudoviricetes sp.]
MILSVMYTRKRKTRSASSWYVRYYNRSNQ